MIITVGWCIRTVVHYWLWMRRRVMDRLMVNDNGFMMRHGIVNRVRMNRFMVRNWVVKWLVVTDYWLMVWT